MHDQSAVPSAVQVAWMPPTLGRAELRYSNSISACCLLNCVEGLVNVTDEVDEKFQGFDACFSRGVSVRENVLEYFYSIHYAVVVVGVRILMPAVREETITLGGKTRSILGYVNKMPIVCLVALWPNFVCPVCDRRKARVAD